MKNFLQKQKMRKPCFRRRGISLVEVLVVIAIVGIIAAIVFPQFSKMKENQVIKNATAETLSAIEKARSQTLSSLNSSEYGVHFQSDKVIIFKGKVFSDSAIDNENIEIVSPANISSTNFSGGGANVFFNRLSGSPSTTGTITIDTTNMQKIITISATGTASIN